MSPDSGRQRSAKPSSSGDSDGESPSVRLLRAMGITGAGTIVAILFGIGTNKALAVLIGPSGLGVVSQLQMFRALLMGLVASGMAASLTRFLSELKGRSLWSDALRLHRSAIYWCAGVGLVLASITLVARDQLASLLLGSQEFGFFIGACAIGACIGGVGLVLQGALNGYREIRALAFCTVAVSALNLVLMWLLSAGLGTSGASIAVALLPIGSLLIYAMALRLKGYSPTGGGKPSATSLREPLRFGGASLATDVLKNATFIATRTSVIGQFGLIGNGWYQAVLTLSDQYFNVLTTSVTTYVLPTLAALGSQGERNEELNRVGRVMFLLLTPIVVGMLVLGRPILTLLYSAEFSQAVAILEWQLLGGFFRMLAWTLGAPLLIVATPRFIIGQELVWDVFYLGGIVLLPVRFGLSGIGMAFVLASSLHAVLLWSYMHRSNGFRWSGGNLRLLGSSLLVIAAVFLTGPELLHSVIVGSSAIVIWLLVNFRDDDRRRAGELLGTLLKGNGDR